MDRCRRCLQVLPTDLHRLCRECAFIARAPNYHTRDVRLSAFTRRAQAGKLPVKALSNEPVL